eukprot:TRINITY_DN27178_c0_g1_i1.p1 TRINITY_DN27178_c0_g1~~TRINITY_DN27178_c0_g1_i1.p1  ORF type:complete len:199 (-),score=32.24 TRINITY_DN27178_c0_g1_i1:41-637(-)
MKLSVSAAPALAVGVFGLGMSFAIVFRSEEEDGPVLPSAVFHDASDCLSNYGDHACAVSALQVSVKATASSQRAFVEEGHETCKPARSFECKAGEYRYQTGQCCMKGIHTCVPTKYTFECKSGQYMMGLCCMEGIFTCLPVEQPYLCRHGDHLAGQCCMRGYYSCVQVDRKSDCDIGVLVDGQCCRSEQPPGDESLQA